MVAWLTGYVVISGVAYHTPWAWRMAGWSDTPRIKYIMFLPDTPLLLLATVVRGVNTLLGRADAVMATARGALPRKSITSSVPVLIPCCFAMSRKPDFQPAAQSLQRGFQPASSLFSYEATQNRMQDPRIPKKVLTHNNVRPPYELVKPLWRLTEAQDVEAYNR